MHKYLMLLLLLSSSLMKADDTWLTSMILGSAARSRTLFLQGVHWRNELLFKGISQDTQQAHYQDIMEATFKFGRARDGHVTINSTFTLRGIAAAFAAGEAATNGGRITSRYGSCQVIPNSIGLCLVCQHTFPKELLQKAINDIG